MISEESMEGSRVIEVDQVGQLVKDEIGELLIIERLTP